MLNTRMKTSLQEKFGKVNFEITAPILVTQGFKIAHFSCLVDHALGMHFSLLLFSDAWFRLPLPLTFGCQYSERALR